MQNENIAFDWQRENDEVETATYEGVGVAVYKSGDQWFYNAWNDKESDGLLFDGFDMSSGAFRTADGAKRSAERIIRMYCNG